MPDGFGVQPAALTAASSAIDDALGRLGPDMPAGLAGGAVGHERLSIALADFGDQWSRGVAQLSGDAQRFSQGLRTTADEYQRGEARIAESLSGTTD